MDTKRERSAVDTTRLEVDIVFKNGDKETLVCANIVSADVHGNLITFLNGDAMSDVIKMIPRENIWQLNAKKLQKPNILN